MFVRFFFAEILFNFAATRTERIARIQNVDQHIGRVNHLVQFVPDPFRLTRMQVPCTRLIGEFRLFVG